MKQQHLKNVVFVFDFDSTLTQVEAFEELGEISLKNHPDKEEKLQTIKHITDLGIDGEISFTESLERRLSVLQAHKSHLDVLIKRLKSKLSDSVKRNRNFFKHYHKQIIVISAGFKEFITPIVEPLGIMPHSIYANTFVLDEVGNIVGFDRENDLSKPDGKIYQLKKLNLSGEIFVIGDGYSDYQMREAGIAHKFFAYTENITRQKILSTADHITPSFDEFLYLNRIKGAISYPKNRIVVLVDASIPVSSLSGLVEEGYSIIPCTDDELPTKFSEASIVMCRHPRQLDFADLTSARKLLALGFTDELVSTESLLTYSFSGIPVFNAPLSQVESKVELTLQKLFWIARHKTNKSGLLSDCTVGISGLGAEGSLLAEKLNALGVRTTLYAPAYPENLYKANRVDSLTKLTAGSDIVVLCPTFKEEFPRFSRTSFAGAAGVSIITNGGQAALPIEILKSLLADGIVSFASIDEPNPTFSDDWKYFKRDSRVEVSMMQATGTKSALFSSAKTLSESLIAYINTGRTTLSVNIPQLSPPEFPGSHRLLHLHRNVPGVLAAINTLFSYKRINVSYQQLLTNKQVGYLVADIDTKYDQSLLDELKRIPSTLRFRVLY